MTDYQTILSRNWQFLLSILFFMLQSIPYFWKTLMSAVSKVKDYQRAHVCQRCDRAFALYFYGGLVKDCRVGLSWFPCPGYIMCLKEVALAYMCDLVIGWRHQTCDECMLDSEPSWESLFFPCKSEAPCLDTAPVPVPSAPLVVPLLAALVTSVPVRANREPSCCAYTHQVLAESNS